MDLTGLGLPALLVAFAAAAVATWVAGLYLSRATDALDDRLGLGEALGGMILLAIAGSLPEFAITVSAALNDNLDMAAGNLIGGIAMQTLVLVICDAALRGQRPLGYLVASLVPVVEAALVAAVVSTMLMGALLPESAAVAGVVSPASIAIVVVWLGGIAVLNRMRTRETWRVVTPDEGAIGPAAATGPAAPTTARPAPATEGERPYANVSTARTILIFIAASIVTLIAGVILERTGDAIASTLGIDGVLFGATVLAAASALPEISTGIAAVRLGDYQLAMGDILGGNAFQLCLFLVADLLAGQPALPQAGPQNAWLGVLGISMTVIYAASVIVRPSRRYGRFGIDSLLVLLVYVIGMIGFAQVGT